MKYRKTEVNQQCPQPNLAARSTRFIPLVDWPKHHSWPPLGGLRHLVFNAKGNGFDRVIRRVGRRILIDEEEGPGE